MTRVLIAGCGYVGSALGARLAAEGHTVWGLRREPAALPPQVQSLAADLQDPDTLRNLPAGLDTVFYTAGRSDASGAAYRAAYVDGVRHVLDALTSQGQHPRRVIFTSSTSVYTQAQGEWVDETSPTTPAHIGGQCLLEGERLLLEGPFPATVVRLGGIYGPGRTRLIDSVRAGTTTYQEGRPAYTNRIHRDDCVGVLRHIMRLAQPAELYLGVDHRPEDRGAVLRWLASQLDVPPPQVEPLAAPPSRSQSNKRCRNARLLASGYTFRYPTFQHGYEAILSGAP